MCKHVIFFNYFFLKPVIFVFDADCCANLGTHNGTGCISWRLEFYFVLSKLCFAND